MAAPVRLAVSGGVVFFLGLIVGFWGFQKVLNSKINDNVALKKGSEMRKMWSKTPIAVDFKMYLFNITNPMQVAKGDKPIVQEVGPFFYDEWKEKVELEDDNDADLVSFHMKNKWIFNPGKSNGLTGDEIITIPHMAMMSMIYMTEMQKPGALSLIAKALGPLFNDLQIPFVTTKARNILFDGIPINCSSNEFAPKAVCTQIKANPKGLIKQGENIYLFSLFGAKNNTKEEGRFTVKRGVQDAQQVGEMVRFNGKAEQSVWSGPECNALRGTDSTIFPPFIKEGNEILSFSPDLCRSLGAKFRYKTVYKGIPTYFYTADLGDQSSNMEEKCFCPTPTTCMKKGLFDITKCTGAPIILSLPHFYETDPDYLNDVIGLHPNVEDHQIFMYFEPISGTPLGARKRLQFNINIHPVKKVPMFKELPRALTPIMWVEEGLELDDEFIEILEKSLFRTMKIVGAGRWIVMLLGLALIGAGAFLYYKRQQVTATKTIPKTKASPISTIHVAENNKF